MQKLNKHLTITIGCFLIVATSCTRTLTIRKNLNQIRKSWYKDSTTNFVLYFPLNTYADSTKVFLQKSIEKYRLEILALMQENNYSPKIETFFFPSKTLMNKTLLTNAEGISFASENVCAFTFAKQFNGYTKHELSHIFSINLWGRSATWIEEGFATLTDESFQTIDFHKQAKALLGTKDFIIPEDLFKNFNKYNGNWYRYVEAASMLKFIIDKYGIASVKQIWKTKKFETENIKEADLIKTWISHITNNLK